MKRRNGEIVSGKLRRPTKRNKIGDGLNSSPFIYLKFLLVWALVLLADFILEFRFEYLWPFWLLLRSVYDSFKYQGLAFSVFFVLIALTSDMICFLFIPVHWLFFAASTYVWVQYVWHTERGICLPTVSLWLLFVYIEASVRLRELKNLPFHLDLCRPFAAHCIGYPVVTLGFGFKSYVSYRIRLRRQKEVAKENEFYVELLQKALPQDTPPPPAPSLVDNELTNGVNHMNSNHNNHNHSNHHNHHKKSSISSCSGEKPLALINSNNSHSIANGKLISEYDSAKKITNGIDKHELQYMEHQIIKKIANMNEYDNEEEENSSSLVEHNNKTNSCSQLKNVTLSPSITSSSLNKANCLSVSSNGSATTQSNTTNKWNHVNSNCLTNTITSTTSTPSTNSSHSNVINSKKSKNSVANNLSPVKDDHLTRLEADMKRLKADLQASRQTEMDLRIQLSSVTIDEKSVKNELTQLRQDNDNLQSRLHNLVTARQQDKQTIAKLEKSLEEEKRRLKLQQEAQLGSEKKLKKAEEAAARAMALSSTRTDCSDSCKSRRRDIDNDLKQMQHELKLKEEQLKQSDKVLRQYKCSHDDAEVLMSALSAMQDKNNSLEKSLSAETRLKLDLFSALDETKRQLEMTQAMLAQREKETDELKAKIADVMAVMPSSVSTPTSSYGNLGDN